MPQFNIVHLSDLHIGGKEDGRFARVRDSLIDDLYCLTVKVGMNIDAIAITGDVIDRGTGSESFKITEEFFKVLTSTLQIEKDKLVFVPGNHDVPRKHIVPLIMGSASEEDFQDLNASQENWENLGIRFSAFTKFVSNLTNQSERSQVVFGGSFKDVVSDKGTVRFVQLNSSWSSIGNSDYEKLRIGRWQLESLKNEVKKAERADLTLALMHHPLDWLSRTEHALTKDFLKSKYELSVDALLHGHIHDGGIDISTNPDGSLVTFVSGIGYPKADELGNGLPKLSMCRYAIYNFNTDRGTIDVTLRITRADGSFVSDTQLYTAGGKDGCFTINVKPQTASSENLNKKEVTGSKIMFDPVPVRDFVGRSDELKDLLDPKLKLAAITGIGGLGKTSLAAEYFRRYAWGKDPNFEVGVWVDCRELALSLHSKIIELLETLSGGVETVALYRDETLKDTAKRFLSHLKLRRTLVVFDNVDAYVSTDSEGVNVEFKTIVETILNNEHQSLVLFTCRPPFSDNRQGFRSFRLNGFNDKEAIAYFSKRNVALTGDNDIKYIDELILRTNGHPYWLGLIAGQILSSKKESLKKVVGKLSRGESSSVILVDDYFKDIWAELNKDKQRILRFLAESFRPLTESEICSVVNRGAPKTRQELRRLERLGLLEQHEATSGRLKVFQVHPIIREYVHDHFDKKEQRPYVYKLLELFIPDTMVKLLFIDVAELYKQYFEMSPKSLMDSIETCLSSRNPLEALALLERYQELLYNNGFHHQFRSIACRVLDDISWEKSNLLKRPRGQMIIGELIHQLGNNGDSKRAINYLAHFHSLVVPNTPYYLGYLSIAAYNAWQCGNPGEALRLCDQYNNMAEKQNLPEFDFFIVQNTKALVLRDIGQYKQALDLFDNANTDEAIRLGNCAKCLLKLGNFQEAELRLRKSLILLKEQSTYLHTSNTGYAYLWLAELRSEQKMLLEARAFLRLAEEVWSEYAPGLINHVYEMEKLLLLDKEDKKMSLWEAQVIEHKFLAQNDNNDIDESSLKIG
jgi:3',5'-cyclic AMP phosphodiesterase CpdA/tetratricopeptide (TPR) repeat protein